MPTTSTGNPMKPNYSKAFCDKLERAKMQQLLAAGWQRSEDGQWMSPDNDQPVALFVAVQTLEVLNFDETS